jgi:hypothetical protein
MNMINWLKFLSIRRPSVGGGRRIGVAVVCCWLALLAQTSATPALNPNDPIGFFTTVADRLLRNTFGFGVTNIPVCVNGQFVYTPAVNRVLQVSANLYEASTNSFYPDVFRPIFEHDAAGNVFVVGYTNLSSTAGLNTVAGLNDPQLLLPLDIVTIRNLGPAYTPVVTNGNLVNVYGVPWIIGVKKGFPNFNKFGMQTVVQVLRRLQITRSSIPTTATTTFLTNQLLNFSISNYVNAECWNSYTNPYLNPVYIEAQDTLSMMITNDAVPFPAYFNNYLVTSNTFVARWSGYTNNYSTFAFTNPLSSRAILLNNDDFYFGTAPPGIGGFYPDSSGFGWESNNFNLKLPQFGLIVTNRLQLYMLDGSNGTFHLIDYVQFAGPQTTLNITAAIETNNPETLGYGSNMWSQSVNAHGIPYGVASQLLASEEPITANNGSAYWSAGLTTEAEIDGFSTFMGLTEPYPSISFDNPTLESFATNYVVQVPYTATATISQYTSWQANDPFVHYLTNDLDFTGTESSGIATGVQTSYGAIGNQVLYPTFNSINERYQPWGLQYTNDFAQIGSNAIVASPYGLAYKDPLVWSADYWNFPTNLLADLTGLGQVHRGTPWQTIYLKSADVLNILDSNGDINSGTNTWVAWTGDYNVPDAAVLAPVNDRQLVSLLISLLNTNDVTQLMSVNDANPADWLNILNGLTVYSNSTTLPPFALPRGDIPSPTFDSYTMADNSPQAQIIANGIAQAKTGEPNQKFYTIGDILSAPVLTENSPWLNYTNANQQAYGISDAAYEVLPAQLLLLLRPDSIGAMFLTNGGANLQFSGSDSYTYEVQASTDLMHWFPISTNQPTQGSFNVAIPPTPNSPQKFYRTVLLP